MIYLPQSLYLLLRSFHTSELRIDLVIFKYIINSFRFQLDLLTDYEVLYVVPAIKASKVTVIGL